MTNTKNMSDKIVRLEKRLAREKSARKQAEHLLEGKSRELYEINQKLNENARLLEATVVNAKDGVIITTADLENGGPEIIYVNEAVTRISGYEPEELIGQTPRILQGPSTCRETLNELKETLLKGKAFKGELQNYTKDGIVYWLDISIVPVKDNAGNITHYAAIERDITDRKIFEKQIQVTKDAAEVASRAKDDFLANMSHELRTPMNGIIGLSELLMDMNLGEEQAELASAVNSSSRNLLILLNDILDLSKIEAGELTLENIAFNVRSRVAQTVDLLRPIASRKGVVLESYIDDNVPKRIVCDPARLQQVMNNLISNGLKFTEEGSVTISFENVPDSAGDPELHIRVQDTGIGIPEDKHQAVFQKFTQADVSTARKYGGTGLGLAITKELVEVMGGQIGLESEVGKGTTFIVKIPVEEAKKEEKQDIVADVVPMNTKARLLVTDDHPVNLLFMRKVLKKLGFENVDEARNGKEAVQQTQKNVYDLILMDCQMPEMDGFEASTIIRESEEKIGDIKIIAVTADAMKGAREKCIDAGMNDYISKPVDLEKLRSVLGEWIPNDTGDVSEMSAEMSSSTTEEEPDLMIMDWERLRMFTDGDPEEEKGLIEMFLAYAEESIQELETHLKNGENEEWRKAAHKFKGSAANLGAEQLSSICFKAEESYEQDDQAKQLIFEHIKRAYNETTAALKEKS